MDDIEKDVQKKIETLEKQKTDIIKQIEKYKTELGIGFYCKKCNSFEGGNTQDKKGLDGLCLKCHREKINKEFTEGVVDLLNCAVIDDWDFMTDDDHGVQHLIEIRAQNHMCWFTITPEITMPFGEDSRLYLKIKEDE